MQQVTTCLRCGKYDSHPFNLLPGGCECTKEQKQKDCDDQFDMMQKHFNGHEYREPTINECKLILTNNGYRVNKVNKNKAKRKRKNKR